MGCQAGLFNPAHFPQFINHSIDTGFTVFSGVVAAQRDAVVFVLERDIGEAVVGHFNFACGHFGRATLGLVDVDDDGFRGIREEGEGDLRHGCISLVDAVIIHQS